MELIKKIYNKNNDLIKVTFAICLTIFLMILSKNINYAYAAPTELPDTLTTGMGNILTDRISLFDGLYDEEMIALVPYYATDNSGTRYTVYCLEKDKGWPSNEQAQVITKNEAVLDNGYVYILQNGYPNKELTGNNAYDDYLTQIAIWWYQDLSANENNLTAHQKEVISASGYYRYIEPLINGALNAKNNPVTITPSFSIDKSNFKLSSDNRYLITDLIIVDSNVSYESYAVSVDNSAIEVLDSSNRVVEGSIDSSQGFKLRVDLSKIDNPISININVVVNYTDYVAYSYDPPSNMADTMQQAVVGTLVGVPKQKTVSASVSMPTGSLTIKKVDSNDNSPLAGASIEVIRKATNKTVASFESTTSDYVINNLLPGEYEIKELEAPNGYYIDKESSSAVITDSNLNVSSTITNSKYDVKIRKVDSDTGNSVRGAVLNIINSDNEVVDTITTTNDYVSVDTTKLSEGTYKVVEVLAPSGYIINEEEKEFTLDRNHTRVTVDFEDEKNEVIIEKKDASDNSFVSGAVLRLIRVSDNQVIDEWTTNSKGHSVRGLEEGEYKVIEVSAPSGYTLSNSEVTFTVSVNQKDVHTITYTNTKNKVTITKVDKETKEPISGARLRVVNSTGDEIDTFTTTDSSYTLEGLAKGTYYIEEIEAPNGYVLDTERESFVVDDNTSNLAVTFENTKNEINLGKVDEDTNQYIAGATLKLTNSEGEEVETFISSSEPYVIRGLANGTYYLEEEKAPAGYIRNTDKITIEVDSDTTSSTYTISNKKSEVTINKIDSESKKGITGAVLELLNSDKVFIRNIDLTDTASITIEGLDEGTYYLKEVNAPLGYILNKDEIKFTIDSNNTVVSVDIPNDKNETIIEKRDADSGSNDLISGAVLRLIRVSDDSVVDEWTTDDSGHVVKGLIPGDYKVVEIKAPSGYTLDNHEVTFTINNNQTEVQTITFYNSKNRIEITKIDSETRSIISGAKLKVTNSRGKEIKSFTTTDEPYVLTGLASDTYYIEEEEAPNGYVKSDEKISFVVDDDTKNLPVTFENAKNEIKLGKVDATTGSLVSGAVLRLSDSNGNEVETFTSSNELRIIRGLNSGTYTLEEVEAPEGYIRNTEKVTIKVDSSTTSSTYTISNKKSSVTINKIDGESKTGIVGAVLELLNSDKEYLRDIDLTNSSSITIEGLPVGTYYLREKTVPNGYLLNKEDVKFTIDSDNDTVDFTNTKNEVVIEKKDASSNELISGAVLRLIRVSDNQVIDEWTSSDEGHSIKGLEKGEYKVVEVEAPSGYTITSSEVFVTITGLEEEAKTVTFYNSKNQITINKIDSETGTAIRGAVLEVTNSEGDVIDTITTTDTPYTIEKLDPGTYYVREIEAPNGYSKTDEVESFVVDDNTTNLNVTLENTKNEIKLGKVDADTNNYISGATLKLSDSSGKEIETFTTDVTPYVIRGLDFGTYTLEEVESPDGYIRTSEKVTIVVDSNTTSSTYTISNKKSSVTINKIDSETNQGLIGSILVLFGSDNLPIRSIDLSTTSSMTIEGLDEGTYYLRELKAPDGYIINEDEISFTIDNNNPTVNVSFPNIKNDTVIEKRDLTSGEYISGAVLRVIRVDTGEVIDEFTTTGEGHHIRGLMEGVYEIREIVSPAGYGLNTGSVSFTVSSNQSSTQTVTFNNSVNQVTISKIDSESNINIAGAVLEVTNSEGEVIDTITTTDTPYALEKLSPGTYYIREIEAPEGYTLNSEIKSFYVDEDTTNLNITFPNTRNEIRLGKIDEDTKEYISGATLRLTNSKGDVIDTFVSDTTPYIIRGLASDTYYLEEIESPDGYIRNTSRVVVKVDSDTTLATYTISNKRSGLTINKIDSETNSLISGAILELLDSNKESIRTIDLSNASSITITGLEEGTYYLKEIKAPSGYVINDEEIRFKLDSTNPNISVDVPNIKNETIIEKRDVNNNIIKGARLRLIRVADNQIIDEWTSDNEGHSVKGLIAGDYKVVEVSAPDGYSLNTEEVIFSISDNQKEVETIVFKNSPNKVTIKKIDSETGSIISGAKLRIINSRGDVIDTFTTTKEPYTINKLDSGTYYIEEIETPSGYVPLTERKSFEVVGNTEEIEVVVENKKTEMYLGKIDAITGEYISGATLRLTDSNGDEVETFKSSNTPYKIEGLAYGKYTLEEVEAPSGYIKTDEKVSIDFNANNTNIYTISNKTGGLTIQKIDSEAGNAVSGATLEIRNSNGDLVKNVTTTNTPTIVNDLSDGTYKIVETDTPEGYIKSDKEYEVTISSSNPNPSVTIENEPIIVNLGKIDARTGDYIAGATMRLSRLDGEMEAITFVSTASPYKVERLVPGIYSLEEIEAPVGYVGTGSIVTFRVLETGDVQTINISNDITTISINNRRLVVDAEAGYKFRLESRSGELIDEFETTNEEYTSEELEIGDYTLRQIEAPDGVIVNDSPIYFSVGESNEVNVINFVNDFTKVEISKKDMANSEEVKGAHLVIRDSKGEIIDEWTSSDSPHYIEKLPVGKYTLTETIAPDGYVLNTSVIDFEVKSTGDIQSEVMYNSKPVEVPNTSRSATYIYLVGGILILIGGVLIYVSYRNKIKKKSIKNI